ncbi:Protein of unknown function [Pyronema omphalodes CBS 100304]|uniref:Uncharacterized protein n=1 Tax=Pyronema omphalodes (strain CBS 100304) TaxID=1076935 RepID=U4LU36_PYROM|nr:Protein of unknown function [Pyronema omphalodes CBS 100304]
MTIMKKLPTKFAKSLFVFYAAAVNMADTYDITRLSNDRKSRQQSITSENRATRS